MPKFVYDKDQGRMVEKGTGEPMVTGDWVPVAPRVVSDIEPYSSPITGEAITSRQHEKKHMAEHGVVHRADYASTKKLKNERFIRKHGLQGLAD